MPEETEQPVGKLKRVTPNEVSDGEQPVGKLKPIGKISAPMITDYSAVDTQDPNKVEEAIEFIAKNPLTKGGMIDVDKEALREVMKNPRATKEQISESIATMQSGNPYYLKNVNGVMIPKELKDGAQPPKGQNVQSVWGTQKDANDDSWYTDLGKSLFNGVLGGVEGVAQLGQLASNLVTDSDSETLGSTINAINSLKMTKDESLNKTMYDTEGVKEWSDLVSKDRFDLSPSALWGTLNSVAESAASFMTGAGAAGQYAKGVQGVQKLGQLSKGAKYATAFTGSTLQMVGDNLDNAREAGLTGRDAGAVAMVQTAAQAGIDAGFGINSLVFRNLIGKGEKEVFKTIVQGVEKDATGAITEQGFKDLAKETASAYSEIAKTGIKEYGKTILQEAGQEIGQDFVGKSAEQLWDKFSDEDKAKFGTNAFDAKSFAQYIQSGLAGAVGGASMGAINLQAKKKYEEQSANAYRTVQKGPEAVDELVKNLDVAKANGSISQDEYNHAVFKVKAYQKYDEQTKDLNLDDKQKQEAFKLSFNIEALKSEVDIPAEDLAKLDPIAHAKINTKKKLAKGLQEELDKIILKENIQTETKTAQKNVDEVFKDIEPKEEKPKSVKQLIKTLGEMTAKPAEKVGLEAEQAKPYKRFQYDRAATPDFDLKDDKGTYEFNKLPDPISRKRALTDYLDKNPELKDEVQGFVHQGQNNVWQVDVGNGRWMQFARSIDPKTLLGDTTNLPDKTETVKDSDGRELTRYKEPVVVKMESITGEKEGREGKRLRIFNVYRKSDGKYIMSLKEKQKGDSGYSEGEIKQMQELQKRGYVPKSEEEVRAAVEAKPKETKVKEVPVDYTRLAKKAESERELDAIIDQADKAGAVIDIDVVAKRRESLKPKVEVKVKKPTLKLNLITDAKSLDRKVEKTYKGRTTKTKVKNEQVKIEKKFENLKQLLDCIHG